MADDDDYQRFVPTYQAIARRTPAIWNVIGPASLNPQPLPPVADSPLNPQPLPPGPPPESYGAYVGRELVKLSWVGARFDQSLESKDVLPVGLFPRKPVDLQLPPWLPPVDDVDVAWLVGYYFGLLCALAMDPNVIEENNVVSGAGKTAWEILQWLLRHGTKPGNS